MNRFPRPPALAPPVNPPPPRTPPPRRPAGTLPSGLWRPAAGIRPPEPGLKDVAAGWVANHPAAGLGAAAAAGLVLGWLLKRR
ncbi:hypothetical protein [Alienimonas sp. DA493]|uniref:hypothetical protein n=1 Tax=Alienimonas sp. DA493 TaxID=3373605 RepID=UPI003754BF45